MSLVQCGWCPVLLVDDWPAWYRHFRQVHGTTGYSIRHIVSSDWDIAELAGKHDYVKLERDSE